MDLLEFRKKADRIWSKYHKMNGSRREEALAHTFIFSGAGLSQDSGTIAVALDGKRIKYPPQKRDRSFADFYEFVSRIDVCGECVFSWAESRASERCLWYCSRREDLLYMEIPGFADGVLTRYADFLASVTENGAPVVKQETQAEKVDRLWRSFLKKSTEKRGQLLSHTLKFRVASMGGNGWQDIGLSLDGASASYHISDIGNSADDFLKFMRELAPDAMGYFSWSREPGSYDWFFSRRDELLYVEVPGIRDGIFIRYDDFVHQITSE